MEMKQSEKEQKKEQQPEEANWGINQTNHSQENGLYDHNPQQSDDHFIGADVI